VLVGVEELELVVVELELQQLEEDALVELDTLSMLTS